MQYLKKWWFWVILVVVAFAIAAYIEMSKASAQTLDPPVTPPADVQALTSQLSNAGCNAALNAAANEIIRLRKQVAQLQAQSMVGKSGATKK